MSPRTNILLGLYGLVLLTCFCFFNSCNFKASSQPSPRLANLPSKILWAWERPENLEFIDAKQFGVAFLAQTLELKGDDVVFRPRRQPLKVSPETKLIAVTRIESRKSGNNPALSDKQIAELVKLILKTLELKNVSAIQIDFDAVVSERDFYRNLLLDLRSKLRDDVPLSITALASFCIGDRWFKDLPVDEAIPMIFRMGADDKNIRNYLTKGGDFREPLCRQSYGIAIDEPLEATLDTTRRLYIFNSNPRGWTERDVLAFQEKSQK